MTLSTSSPSLAKLADRMDGAIRNRRGDGEGDEGEGEGDETTFVWRVDMARRGREGKVEKDVARDRSSKTIKGTRIKVWWGSSACPGHVEPKRATISAYSH